MAERITDETIAWFVREYSRTPEHTVYQMACEIASLRSTMRHIIDNVLGPTSCKCEGQQEDVNAALQYMREALGEG